MPTATYYREKAVLFRELAETADKETAATLIMLAEEYDALAKVLEPDAKPPMPTAG